MRYLGRFDEAIASIALVLMAVIPLIEILVRPFMGKGIVLLRQSATDT